MSIVLIKKLMVEFMGNQFVFSIIIAIYNTGKYLEETFDCLINQSFGFDDVQLVLIDDGSTDNSAEICKKYLNKYPNNIEYIYKENGGQTTARNLGVDFAKGKYINFLDSDDKLELNCLEEIFNFFEKYSDEIDVVAIPRYFFEAKSGPLSLNYRFSTTRVIDIHKEFNCPQVSISSVFIRRSAFDEKFDLRLIVSEDATLINKIILKKEKYGVVNSTKYLYRRRFDENSTIDTKKVDKNYFCPRVKYYMKELIQYSLDKFGYVIRYIQFLLMFDLQWMYEENSIKSALNHTEFIEFESLLYDVYQYIDDDIILSQKYLDRYLKNHIIKFKYQNPNFNLIETNGDVILKYGDFVIDILKHHNINLLDVNIKNGILYLKGVFDSCFDNLSIKLFNNGVLMDVRRVHGGERYALGNQVSNRFYFETEMVLSLEYNEITAIATINSSDYSLSFDYNLMDFFMESYNVSINNDCINIFKSGSDCNNSNNASFESSVSLDNKNEVFTLWISDDDKLPEYPYLSLKSMVLMGHDVILYTYKFLDNVPDGVIVKDANEVMDESKIFRYKNGHKSYSGFANYFRLKRLYELGGTWVDLDIVLIKNINDVVKEDIAICSEPHHNEYIHCNNAILRFPKGDNFVKYMYDYAKKRGKEVNHGETGPHLITKQIFQGNFTKYARFIKTPIFNNVLGWWEIENYFEDPQIILHNVDLNEVVGFHLVNTFFSQPDFNVKDIGIFGALKYSVLNSKNKQEYLSNLVKFGILSEDKSTFLDTINLNRFSSNKTKFSFIIDSKEMSKLDLYLILGSIEKSTLSSFEFIVFGITDIINERFLYKDNAVFINSSFKKFREKLSDFVHGEYIVPISDVVMFKNNCFEKLEFNEKYDVYEVSYSLNEGKSSLYIFSRNFFLDMVNNNYINIFDKKFINSYLNNNIQTMINEDIFGFKKEHTFIESKIINLIDSLFNFNISHGEFINIKNEISDICNNFEFNLSFYYKFCCSILVKSNSFDEFLLRMDNFILNSYLHWEYKSDNYLLDNLSKHANKLSKHNDELSNNVRLLNNNIKNYSTLIEDKDQVISKLQEDFHKKDEIINDKEQKIINIEENLIESNKIINNQKNMINGLNEEITKLNKSICDNNAEFDRSIFENEKLINNKNLLINNYKKELLTIKMKNDRLYNENKFLHEKLDEYYHILEQLTNSKYYKLRKHISNESIFDNLK